MFFLFLSSLKFLGFLWFFFFGYLYYFVYINLINICRMVKGTMQLLLRAIFTLLIVLISEGHPVEITYLQSAVAKGAGKNFLFFN